MPVFKLALLNISVKTGDIADNANHMRELCKQAADNGACAAFAPELSLTGYPIGEFQNFALEPESPQISELCSISSEYGIVLGFGVVLKREGVLYNSYVIADGDIVHLFGKQHRWWYGDSSFGVWPSNPVVDIGGVRVGVMICFDGRFPEIARGLALSGAELIVWPCCWPDAPKSNPAYLDIIGRARAFENQCWVALANRCGYAERERTKYPGRSALFDPLGGKERDAGETDGLFIVSLDTDITLSVREKFDIYAERKPELYKDITSRQAPPWYGGAQ